MDIETATIDELYEEIEKRCNGCVLVMHKPLKNITDNGVTSAFAIRWKDFVLSIGLMEQAKFYFQKYYLESFEDISPSEIGLE